MLHTGNINFKRFKKRSQGPANLQWQLAGIRGPAMAAPQWLDATRTLSGVRPRAPLRPGCTPMMYLHAAPDMLGSCMRLHLPPPDSYRLRHRLTNSQLQPSCIFFGADGPSPGCRRSCQRYRLGSGMDGRSLFLFLQTGCDPPFPPDLQQRLRKWGEIKTQ